MTVPSFNDSTTVSVARLQFGVATKSTQNVRNQLMLTYDAGVLQRVLCVKWKQSVEGLAGFLQRWGVLCAPQHAGVQGVC